MDADHNPHPIHFKWKIHMKGAYFSCGFHDGFSTAENPLCEPCLTLVPLYSSTAHKESLLPYIYSVIPFLSRVRGVFSPLSVH